MKRLNGTALPRIVFLDAVGTLFELQGSVGGHYSEFAADYGIHVSGSSLDQAFKSVFQTAPAPAFGIIDSGFELKKLEKNWWRQVVGKTFLEVLDGVTFHDCEDLNGVPFPDFDECFDRIYQHFSMAAAWSLYPETVSTLRRCLEQGIQLGVISNFDSRLLDVLQALKLSNYFVNVTISSEAGVAKPHPRIFQVALETISCEPKDAIHVGDQYIDDYQGAIGAGLRGVWLNRAQSDPLSFDQPPLETDCVIHSLDQLFWA